jgi:hypothetical protein
VSFMLSSPATTVECQSHGDGVKYYFNYALSYIDLHTPRSIRGDKSLFTSI